MKDLADTIDLLQLFLVHDELLDHRALAPRNSNDGRFGPRTLGLSTVG
jgi:hypothetical protein